MRLIPHVCLATAALTALVSAPGRGQQFPPNRAVDRLFAEWDKPGSPGCALGVARNGRFIYRRGYGMANLDYGIPNSPTMVYYVGSDSKQFTAASIALLALDGKLSLDDDIRKYIPEMPAYDAPITIRHLIHHTSGIRDVYGLMALAGLPLENVFSDSEAIALIVRQRALNFRPGDDYLYSNSGYFLLGQVVKRVTGQSLRVYADEHIFRPLGMTHTHFHDDPGHVMKQRAMSYEPDSQVGFRISYLQNFDKIGAGGLYSTVEDLAKWDENFYTHRVGGEALQQLMHTRGVLNRGDTLKYAFGNNVTRYRGLRITEHGGALMGYKAEVLRFPDQHFTVLETCNLGSINPGRLAFAVADVYLAGRLGPQAERADSAGQRSTAAGDGSVGQSGGVGSTSLAGIVGDYYSSELDATYHVALRQDEFVLSARHRPAEPLVPAGPDSFRAGDITLHFERSTPEGAATGFLLDAGRVRGIRFQRR
jgi:CubicO group peptidase (beta-lactamase class C family)